MSIVSESARLPCASKISATTVNAPTGSVVPVGGASTATPCEFVTVPYPNSLWPPWITLKVTVRPAMGTLPGPVTFAETPSGDPLAGSGATAVRCTSEASTLLATPTG